MIEALYLHFPFCKRKCDYCSFFSFDLMRGPCEEEEDRSAISAYVSFLKRELEKVRRARLIDEVKTVYVGGGTPSLLCAEDVEELFEPLKGLSFSEITFEANPESLSEGLLWALKKAGVTRVSLGVQSINDDELRSVRRLSSAKDCERALQLLDETDLGVSADVIVGLPHQTKESLEKTLNLLLAHRVNHLSVYPLSVEEGTPLERNIQAGKTRVGSEDEEAELMEGADSFLQAAGYIHYEIANYARPGHEAKHNIAYWEGKEYLGLGFAGASMLQKETYEALLPLYPALPAVAQRPHVRKTISMPAWEGASRIHFCWAPISSKALFSHQKNETNGASPSCNLEELLLVKDFEVLNHAQAAAEDLMLGARLKEGLSRETIEISEDFLGKEMVDEAMSELCKEGFLIEKPGGFEVSERGWLLGNHIFGKLWDLAGDTEVFHL